MHYICGRNTKVMNRRMDTSSFFNNLFNVVLNKKFVFTGDSIQFQFRMARNNF